MRSLIAALFALLTPAMASAQALKCDVPAQLPRPVFDGPSDREPVRRMPVGSYTLALIWAPQECRAYGRNPDNRFLCASGNRFGFFLHGLWPDGEGKSWPQYCAPVALLPPAVIRQNICATPVVQRLQHEWAKHGPCMSRRPEDYFAASTGLYNKLRYPDMQALSRAPALTAGRFAQAFAAANPGLRAEMIKVRANRQGWLEEVWLCLDKGRRYMRCKPNSGGMPAGARLRIWR